MLTRIVSLLVLSGFLLGLPVVGQAPSPAAEPTPVIHATTREVLLDFVARDKHHRAISDLHPQEVEVYEDGVLQTVKSFRNIEGAEQLQLEREAAQNQTPTTDSGDVQNTAKGASPAPTLNTLKQINFVSVVFAQIAPLDLDFARRAVLEFLKSDTLPNTFVTVYTMNPSLQLVQDFTGDKDLLAKSVDAACKGVYGTGGLGIDASIAPKGCALLVGRAGVSGQSTGCGGSADQLCQPLGSLFLHGRHAGAEHRRSDVAAAG